MTCLHADSIVPLEPQAIRGSELVLGLGFLLYVDELRVFAIITHKPGKSLRAVDERKV
jgi:hypothetical protein